jgi:hypothetical protein
MATRAGFSAAIILLGVHGLVHLLGPIVYWQLADVDGFPFKTTVLNGALSLGPTGIRVFGTLWLLPAMAFLAAAVGLAIGWPPSVPLLVAAALSSLVLTAAEWPIAWAGAIVDVAILLAFVVFDSWARA